MFTTWDEVRSWIEDNGFPHWIFYKNNPDGRDDKANDKIIDSNNFTVSDLSDKLAMTRKYLEMYGGRVYGVGFKTPIATQGGIVCEASISSYPAQQPVGYAPQPAFDEEKIIARVRKEVEAEYDRKEYQRLRSELDRERKEFESEKNSAMGAIAHYFAPVGKALMQGKLQNVAGFGDASQPVQTQPITPIQEPEQPVQPETVELELPDEEMDRVINVINRLRKVEPRYLDLLERVAELAESGDSMYNMAKTSLLGA